jgi:hypothetical protein
MADPIKLNGPCDSVEAAVRAGFKKIMANNNKQETEEFGFWVVMKVEADGDKKVVKYYYTEAEGGGSSEVQLTLPVGQMVRAHCHTHPKRYSTSNFSTGDARSFKTLRDVRPGIAWYLLSPQSDIRKANEEKDFPGGISVPW